MQWFSYKKKNLKNIKNKKTDATLNKYLDSIYV